MLNIRDKDNKTPFYWFIENDDENEDENIDTFIKYGFDIESIDDEGNTPLHLAIIARHFGDAKANIKAVNNEQKKIILIKLYIYLSKPLFKK